MLSVWYMSTGGLSVDKTQTVLLCNRLRRGQPITKAHKLAYVVVLTHDLFFFHSAYLLTDYLVNWYVGYLVSLLSAARICCTDDL